MAFGYNNYSPYPYGQMNYQPQQYPVQQYQQPQSNDDRIWVANESAAYAYMMAPNSTVRLWDSSRPVFYEKSSDTTGKQFPMVTYEYKLMSNEIAEKPSYITREEFEKRIAELTGGKTDG